MKTNESIDDILRPGRPYFPEMFESAGSPIVSMVEHKGRLYLAKSDGVFIFNEQIQKFEQLKFVKNIDE